MKRPSRVNVAADPETLARGRASNVFTGASRVQSVAVRTSPESALAAASSTRTYGSSAINGSTKDRKSTRLNSSHVRISYAVFCLQKKNQDKRQPIRIQL